MPRLAYFVKRLGSCGFDDVVFSLKNKRGGVTEVSMEVAVRVRLPLDEEVQAASLRPDTKDSQPVVDRVIEFRSAFDMRPFEAVKV